ncbi:MAG: glycosyltransferase [Acidobacteriota bacterium]|nr:glycosyltransferase [Acidobacteriota bacterium]
MKILRIIARLNVGGPAKHVVWLTAGLQNSDCQTVLVAGTVPPGEDDMGYFAEEMGVKPLYLRQMSREVSLKDALTVWKLYRLFLRERPDIVHTHTAKAGTVGRVAGLLYRWLTPSVLLGRRRLCRFVHTYHGHIFHSYYGALKTRLFVTIERMLARFGTDRIIVISEQQRREINEQFRVGRADQFVVIPLGLDTQVFANWQGRRQKFRDELRASDDEILVGIVGRLTEIKNHELFLKSVALFKESQAATSRTNLEGAGNDGALDLSHPSQTARSVLAAAAPTKPRKVRFVVVGDGHLRTSLEELAASLGLNDDVVFAGTRKDPEFFYPALDVVALTSRNEGTPLTLIEAMLNARPVIATSVGGVVDLLGKTVTAEAHYRICERGVSVSPDDAPGFAEGLAHLVEHEDLRARLGERGRQFAAQNYAKERLLKDITDLYQQLVQPKPAAVGARVRKTQFVAK